MHTGLSSEYKWVHQNHENRQLPNLSDQQSGSQGQDCLL